MACLLISARKNMVSIAPLVIGACLTLVYLVSIPITSGSVNPARSTAQALFVGNWALDQLWCSGQRRCRVASRRAFCSRFCTATPIRPPPR
jgi:glycerol uptake facilitator-like aquaporin